MGVNNTNSMSDEFGVFPLQIRRDEVRAVLQDRTILHGIADDTDERAQIWNAMQVRLLKPRRHISRGGQGIATRCVEEGDRLAGGSHLARTEQRPLEMLESQVGQVGVREIMFCEEWETGRGLADVRR